VASAAPPAAEVTMMLTGLVGKVCAFAKAAQPMSPIAASTTCFIISPYRVSQRAFYCPTRVNFPNKVSAIRSAVNGRNCN
jgi:hypothetical protein